MASIQTTMQHDKRQGFHSDTVAMPALDRRHRVPLRQIEATRLTKTNTSDVDAEALAAELRRHVRGEVRFDDGSEHEVNADDAIRARTYADWVAPGTGWDGEERRKGDQPPPDVDRRRP